MPACPNCNHQIRTTDAQCRYCGAPLTPTVLPEPPGTVEPPAELARKHLAVILVALAVVALGVLWV